MSVPRLYRVDEELLPERAATRFRVPRHRHEAVREYVRACALVRVFRLIFSRCHCFLFDYLVCLLCCWLSTDGTYWCVPWVCLVSVSSASRGVLLRGSACPGGGVELVASMCAYVRS